MLDPRFQLAVNDNMRSVFKDGNDDSENPINVRRRDLPGLGCS